MRVFGEGSELVLPWGGGVLGEEFETGVWVDEGLETEFQGN
jgi:hypothetical protein